MRDLWLRTWLCSPVNRPKRMACALRVATARPRQPGFNGCFAAFALDFEPVSQHRQRRFVSCRGLLAAFRAWRAPTIACLARQRASCASLVGPCNCRWLVVVLRIIVLLSAALDLGNRCWLVQGATSGSRARRAARSAPSAPPTAATASRRAAAAATSTATWRGPRPAWSASWAASKGSPASAVRCVASRCPHGLPAALAFANELPVVFAFAHFLG